MSRSARSVADVTPTTQPITGLIDNNDIVNSEYVQQVADQAAANQTDKQVGVRSGTTRLVQALAVQGEEHKAMRAILEQLTELNVKRESSAAPDAQVPSARGPEARAPEKFDGTNPSKLRAFLAQVRLVFLNHPRRFSTDRAKVRYAGSYLSGVAQDWFEPFTGDDGATEDQALDSWTLFTERLEKTFGDSNAVATAEFRLSTLRMSENEQVSEYITRFRTYSTDLAWDDSPLKFAFRRGLADRILDELARGDPPTTLSDLIETSLRIDNRHWNASASASSFQRLPPAALML